MSNHTFIRPVNRLFSIRSMDGERAAILGRVLARMSELGVGWADLADEIDRVTDHKYGSTRQMVENWKRRGIPEAQHQAVALALGWKVEQLHGRADPGARGWPFRVVPEERYNRLSEADQLAVEVAMLKKLEELEQEQREKNQHKRPGPANTRPAGSRSAAS